MIQDKDYVVRLVQQVADALRKSVASKAELALLFEETTGISSSFLTPAMVGLVPQMLNTNLDPVRSLLAAQILADAGSAFGDAALYRNAARQILESTSAHSFDLELDSVRRELAGI